MVPIKQSQNGNFGKQMMPQLNLQQLLCSANLTKSEKWNTIQIQLHLSDLCNNIL